MAELDDVQEVRTSVIETLPKEYSSFGKIPSLADVYSPPSHLKALRMECNLVIGARGVGKTFWSSALRSTEIRSLLGNLVPNLSNLEVTTGFGIEPGINDYPDGDVLTKLLTNGIDAYHIWRGVVARWLANKVSESIPAQSWNATVDWVRSQPEAYARLLEQANLRFESEGSMGLIIFDALDRTSDDWQTMDNIVRDLLRVILSLKGFSRLHGKVFLREDQFENRRIAIFPDASKLLSTSVNLTWALHDLHGLLWQRLCNGPDLYGRRIRNFYLNAIGHNPIRLDSGAWKISDSVKRDGPHQRRLFEHLAGKWMGKDRRRGIPYLWSVGHLADGRGRTSPRSFLAAIGAAAEDSMEKYPDYPLALHYESIKRGVQKASQIRVNELAEEYPWVHTLMDPLRGLTVPCSFESIEERWISDLGEEPADMSFERLPPENYRKGWAGIREDLNSLGIFEKMKDGRVNMPDLYRVGFGLGRRGGVKPLPKSS